MAEIKIQEKKNSIWPWVIALLIIAAIIYFVVYYMEPDPVDNDGVNKIKFNSKNLLTNNINPEVMKGEFYG
jgi:hypothetical protein